MCDAVGAAEEDRLGRLEVFEEFAFRPGQPGGLAFQQRLRLPDRKEPARGIPELSLEPGAIAAAHGLPVERAAGEGDRIHRRGCYRSAAAASRSAASSSAYLYSAHFHDKETAMAA